MEPSIIYPSVTIIITNYNYMEYLPNCIESAIGQIYPNFEVLIVDDCSTDDSMKLLIEYEKKYEQIHIVQPKKNGGVSRARNLGVRSSSGEYITFLDADDYYGSNNVLMSEMGIILSKRGRCAAYSCAAFLEEDRISYYNANSVYRRLKYLIANSKEGMISDFIPGCYVSAGLCFKKELFFQTGGFNPEMSLYEDLDFLIRLSFCVRFRIANNIGIVHRVKKGGLSDRPEEESRKITKGIHRKYYLWLKWYERLMVKVLSFVGWLQIKMN